MRKTSLELQQRSFPHKVEFNILPPSGPIPIEVFTREPNKKTVTRKVVSKTKTGYKSRLEQRQSVLKGDPNKYSWPTHKKNKETKEH